MKRIFSIFLIALVSILPAIAQSTMTDEQVVSFVKDEKAKGTENQQIVTMLIQRGVTTAQLQRIRRKYDHDAQNNTLGEKKKTVTKSEGHMRKAQVDLTGFVDKVNVDDEDEQKTEEEQTEKTDSKIFGHDIFNNTSLTFEPNMNIATPDDYRLGAGDEVVIEIYGASQKTIQATVSPDGTVTIEGYGPVALSGLTVAQANYRLRNELGERYESSRIQLTVGQTKTMMVNIMGEVRFPGTYTLSAFASVFHALYMAGGPNDIGTLRNIKVYRNNKLVTAVDVYDYILSGKLTGNVMLSDNDVIVVDPYDCLVAIEGKVKRPMVYEMKRTESVADIIDFAGGFMGDAYRKNVRLTRKSGVQYSVHNVDEFEMKSFTVNDGDVVQVDNMLPRYQNTVEIKGAVFRPGLYQLGGNIQSVRSLVEAAEGVTEHAFTQRAVMHRMKKDRSLEVQSIDLDGILNGRIADIALRNEDVLYIHSQEELKQQRKLTIYGEVLVPGEYEYAENMTVEDLILQAGGLTDAASVMKVDVSRRLRNAHAVTASDTIAEMYSMTLKDGFVVDGAVGFTLQPFDVVFVRTSPGYLPQSNVYVVGEVSYPGSYTLTKKNQRISDIIELAGGLTNSAFVRAARLERTLTPDERVRRETLKKVIEKQNSEESDSIKIETIDLSTTYSVALNLEMALKKPHSEYDVVLREGDRIVVPELNNTVKVNGDVLFPNTVTYNSRMKWKDYVNQAGGWGNQAKKNGTFIIYANGSVAKASKGKIEPGCEIVVPSKHKAKKMSTGEVVALASGTASIATMVATMVNVLSK